MLLPHFEIDEKIADGAGELALVFHCIAQTIKGGTGLLLDPGTPEFDEPPGGRRWRQAGEAFARDQGDGILERCLGPFGDALVIRSTIAVIQHGGDVGGDAFHAAGADAFDAGLLDRFKDGAGRLAFRQIAAMDPLVMAGKTERH